MLRVLSLIVVMIIGCSSYEVRDSDRGALAGAAIGGGLGATLGSQAGSAAGGLALGAVAGAGVGAMIGEKMQNQKDTIADQAELINRQQQELNEHRNQIDELRLASQDQVVIGQSPKQDYSIQERNLEVVQMETQVENIEAVHVESLEQPQILPIEDVAPTPEMIVAAQPAMPTQPSVSCPEADEELQQAEKVTVNAEKLYHFRRALRICPNSAKIHLGLSKIYLAMDRKEDARFELQEVMKLEPENIEAQSMLQEM